MPRYRYAFIVACVGVLLVTIGLYSYAICDRYAAVQESRALLEARGILHEAMVVPLAVDEEGVRDPLLVPATPDVIDPDEIIIGVTAFGQSRAYVRRAFDNSPARHVVHDRFGSIPVTVTHCDMTRKTRVFTSSDYAAALDVRCGGWLPEQEMSLLVQGKEYAHSSSEIPLNELPFVIMTWEQWQKSQPESLVYLGPLGAE
jgi:hypothetical protein